MMLHVVLCNWHMLSLLLPSWQEATHTGGGGFMLPGSKRCSLSCYRLQHHKTIIKLAGRWQAKPVNRFQRDTRRFIICFLRGQGQPGLGV